MKKHLLFWFLIAMSVGAASAQRIAKPTLDPKPETEAQKSAVMEGIKFHDQKQFDAAIKKYNEVLSVNPDSTLALYELAISQYAHGDKEAAIETAVRGSKYKSQHLALFYQVIANVIDDVGKPNEAIRIYREGIEFIKDDKSMRPHLSSMHFNLGVTYVRQNKYAEARPELKKAVEYNYAYASPHYLLSEVYLNGKYKVPAIAAAARFLSLEFSTQRSVRAAAIIRSALKPAPKNDKTGNIDIFVDLNAPKDEGDYGMFDLFLGTLTLPGEGKDKNTTEEERFADGFASFVGLLDGDKKNSTTFVGKNYVPFLSEMRKRGFVKPFAYIVLHRTGSAEAQKWISENGDSTMAFLTWAKTYELPSR